MCNLIVVGNLDGILPAPIKITYSSRDFCLSSSPLPGTIDPYISSTYARSSRFTP
jgi:hypothetical protein